jgi:hypothetical protein
MGRFWLWNVALLLLVGALPTQAEEHLTTTEISFLTAIQQNQKLERSDFLLFLREEENRPQKHSTAWFSVRPDYYQYAFNDQFTRRQEPSVAGIKAIFSF